MKRESLIKLWLKVGLPLGVVCGVPSLAVLIWFGPKVPYLFSDWDEPFYLYASVNRFGLAEQIGLSALLGGKILSYPNIILDILFGGLFSISTNIRIPILVGLDIFCDSLVIAIIVSMALSVGIKTMWSSLIALLAVLGSEIYHPRIIFWIPFSIFQRVISVPIRDWPAIPNHRGLCVQLSIVMFYFCVLTVWRYLTVPSCRNSRNLIIAGFLAGINICFYFYGWLAASTLVGLLLLLTEPNIQARVSSLLRFVIGWLVGSAPGLLILANQHWKNSLIIADKIATVWFFPIESSAIIICLLIVRRRISDRIISTIVNLMCSVLLSEIVLYNLQPLMRRQLFPYHFDVFYFGRFFSFLFLLLVFYKIKDLFLLRYFELPVKICFLLIVFYSADIYIDQANKSVDLRREIQRLSNYPPGLSYAVSEIENPNTLYIAGLVEINPFYVVWDPDISVQERAKKNIIQNRIYKGKYDIGYTCQIENPTTPELFFTLGLGFKRVTTDYDLLFCSATDYKYSLCTGVAGDLPNILIVDLAKDTESAKRFSNFKSLHQVSISNSFAHFHVDSTEGLRLELCKEEQSQI